MSASHVIKDIWRDFLNHADIKLITSSHSTHFNSIDFSKLEAECFPDTWARYQSLLDREDTSDLVGQSNRNKEVAKKARKDICLAAFDQAILCSRKKQVARALSMYAKFLLQIHFDYHGPFQNHRLLPYEVRERVVLAKKFIEHIRDDIQDHYKIEAEKRTKYKNYAFYLLVLLDNLSKENDALFYHFINQRIIGAPTQTDSKEIPFFRFNVDVFTIALLKHFDNNSALKYFRCIRKLYEVDPELCNFADSLKSFFSQLKINWIHVTKANLPSIELDPIKPAMASPKDYKTFSPIRIDEKLTLPPIAKETECITDENLFTLNGIDLVHLKMDKRVSPPFKILFPDSKTHTTKLFARFQLIQQREANDTKALIANTREDDLLSTFYLAVTYSRTQKQIGRALTLYAKFLLQLALGYQHPKHHLHHLDSSEFSEYKTLAENFISDIVNHDSKKDIYKIPETVRSKYQAYAKDLQKISLKLEEGGHSFKKIISEGAFVLVFRNNINAICASKNYSVTTDIIFLALMPEVSKTYLEKLLKIYTISDADLETADILQAALSNDFNHLQKLMKLQKFALNGAVQFTLLTTTQFEAASEVSNTPKVASLPNPATVSGTLYANKPKTSSKSIIIQPQYFSPTQK